MYEITTLELAGLVLGALAVGYVIGFIRSAVRVHITAKKFTSDDVIPSHLIVRALMRLPGTSTATTSCARGRLRPGAHMSAQ